MREITTILDTTVDHFSGWLAKYTAMLPYKHFATDRGRWALQSARFGTDNRIDIEGVFITRSEDGQSEIANYDGSVISFYFIKLAPARIEVKAECSYDFCLDYFCELLVEIAKCWPEALPDIAGWIRALTTGIGAAPDAPTSPTSNAGKEQGQEEKAESKPEDLAKLRQIIIGHFDEGELRDLYFDLGIGYGGVPGHSTNDKARELIAYCIRHSRISDLLAKLEKLYPAVSWKGKPD